MVNLGKRISQKYKLSLQRPSIICLSPILLESLWVANLEIARAAGFSVFVRVSVVYKEYLEVFHFLSPFCAEFLNGIKESQAPGRKKIF